MKPTILLLIGIILCGAPDIWAEVATEQEMERVCHNWLTLIVQQQGAWAGATEPAIVSAEDLHGDDGRLLARCFLIAPVGFVLVPTLKEMPPIKAYSEEFSLDVKQRGGMAELLRGVLQHRTDQFVQIYGSLNASQHASGEVLLGRAHRREWNDFSKDKDSFLETIKSGETGSMIGAGPLLTTSWHQLSPYNDYCPEGDGGTCVVGCVATAAAQVMKYHEWPPIGTGDFSYSWNGDQSCGGDVGGGILYADFSDSYNWAEMPDRCDAGCSPTQEDALAELCYEVGIAFEMDYGACSSGANTYYAVSLLPTYFRYDPGINQEFRVHYTASEWFDLIQAEIDANRPMLYSIQGHAIVCDGWRIVESLNQYHMNYGWGGSQTAWYTIDSLYCPLVGGGCNVMAENMIRNIEPLESTEITVFAPNGGELLYGGDSYSITWATLATPDSISILLSIDSGVSYTDTIVSGLSGVSEYDWAVTAIPTSTARIKAVAYFDGISVNDESDNDFTIDCYLEIDSPNGDEFVGMGTQYLISWTTDAAPDSLSIFLSIDGGAYYDHIVATGLINVSSYNWTVPAIRTNTAKIKVVGYYGDIPISEESDNNFTIDYYLEVDSPNGGELVGLGTQYLISWTEGLAPDSLSILLSIDDGAFYDYTVATGLTGVSTYDWTVPDIHTNTARIKVVAYYEGTTVSDESDDDFIIDYYLEVLSPNGGEIWDYWNTYDVEWTTLGYTPDSISIVLSIDSGVTYVDTIAAGLFSANKYEWAVPAITISAARIMVVGYYSSYIASDVSDDDFTIQCNYKYASPAGNDMYPYAIPAWAAHSIQDAVDAASPGDTIMVSAATYGENVMVTTPLYILGGWNGDFSVRDPEAYESCIQKTGTAVSFMNLGVELCGIEGMTLVNGTGTSTSIPTSGVYGGGVFSYSSSPLIKDNVFINCGVAGTTGFSAGGAIACYDGDVVIEGNELSACKAQSGGGIYVYQVTAEIRDNVIAGSYANASYSGERRGGGLYAYRADVMLEGNVISGCYEYKDGGGLYSRFSQTSLSGDSIYDNTVLSYGGGIYAERDSIVISHAVVTGNSSGSFAGGIYLKTEHVEMTNSIVALNSAMLGGGFYPDSVSGVVVNNTFDRNEAAVMGGNLYITNAVALDVRNNIISYGAQSGIYIPNLTGMTVGYNNAFGNTPTDYLGTAPDTTNISLNPHYADTTALDYHLLVHSGSIDAGDPAVDYQDPDGSRNDQGAFGGSGAVVAALEYVKNASAAPSGGSTIEVTWDEIVDPTLDYYVICGDTTEGFVPDETLMLGTVPAGKEFFDHDPAAGCWYYHVSAVNTDGYGGGYSVQADACADPGTGMNDPVPVYADRLEQNYPNPFNGTTTIRYSLESKSAVDIRIYDTAGRLIRILEQKTREPGQYETVWRGVDDEGRAVASGVYFCRITTGLFSQTRKIVYLR